MEFWCRVALWSSANIVNTHSIDFPINTQHAACLWPGFLLRLDRQNKTSYTRAQSDRMLLPFYIHVPSTQPTTSAIFMFTAATCNNSRMYTAHRGERCANAKRCHCLCTPRNHFIGDILVGGGVFCNKSRDVLTACFHRPHPYSSSFGVSTAKSSQLAVGDGGIGVG